MKNTSERTQFMTRLKKFIKVAKKMGKEYDYKRYHMCPASSNKDFSLFNSNTQLSLCPHCREIMKTNDRCPCIHYGADKALELAEKKVKEYFGNK